MRGIIIVQEVAESPMDYVHGFTFQIKRILIPEANDIVVTVHHDNLYVKQGDIGEYEVIKEIDVPDEFVERAMAFLGLRDELLEDFRGLFESATQP